MGKSDFCSDPIWNGEITWNNTYPEFTDCFQNTVLILVPCGLLWVVSPLYFWHIFSHRGPALVRNKLNISKCVVSILLAILSIVIAVQALTTRSSEGEDLGTAVVVSPFIRAFTMIFTVIIIQAELRRGVITSGVLWIFWLLETIAGIIPFYTNIIQQKYSSEGELVTFTVFYIDYAFIILQLILHSFAENPRFRPTFRKRCPESIASFPSIFSFSWVTSLVVKGYKKTLEEEDIWDLVNADKCAQIVPRFERAWQKELETFKNKRFKELTEKRIRTFSNNLTSEINISREDTDERTPLLNGRAPKGESTDKKKQKKPSLLKTLVRVYGCDVLFAHLCKLIKDVLTFLNPILLRLLIEFTDSTGVDKQQTWRGYSYAAGIFAVTALMTLLEQYCFYLSFRVGMRMRASLISAIYKKALTMNNLARKESTVGEIVNLMSVDAQRFEDMLGYLWSIWSGPLQIALAVYFLYGTVGPSVFAGLGVIIILFPINGYIMVKTQQYQDEQMAFKDERIKVMNELLNGMKVLKLYAWELSFREKIIAIRNKELRVIKKAGILNGFGIFSWTLAPYLISLATFATYVYTSEDHYLSAQKAFVAIALFNILRFAINLTPLIMSELVKSLVSLRRITNFLCHDDLDSDSVQHNDYENDAIVVESGTFSWDHTIGECLKDINLSIPEGGLVAVVGQVGCGKSSLLSAMLGEMNKLRGKINVKGRVAYVPQEAWIQNTTLQNNILFGSELRTKEYNRILEACALGPDLEILPAKDQTEIGEKGINLSGGQKQRVSLARAVYNNADIYLLDDPLSAVDSHVGKHIFDQIISSKGLLKGKTRVLVTHGVHWLPMVDRIIVLVNGEISEIGSYDELMTHDGAFAQFLKTYLLESTETDTDEEVQATRSKMLERLKSVTSEEGDHDVEEEVTLRKRLISTSSHTSDGKKDLGRSISQQDKKTTKDEPQDNKDRLTEDEQTAAGSVSWAVYLTYFRALGVLFTILLCSLYAFYQVGMIYSNIWLSQWTEDDILKNRSLPANSSVYRKQNDYYLGVYGGLGAGQGMFVLSFSFLMVIRTVAAASKLHSNLLMNILRSPMAFFDTTPIGRIVNRFSKDIDSVDEELPALLGMWMDSMYFVLSTFIVISYSTPIFLSVVLPLFIFYYIIQKFYVSTSRQLKRLESKTRSPIFSHFSETISGASVIRAFGAKSRFIFEQQQKVDHNHIFYFAGISANRWLGVFLETVGNLTVLAASMFAVSERDSLQGGLMGLSISYALEITGAMTWMVRMTSDVETNIVSVERINEYTNTPTEAEWYNEDRKPPGDWPEAGVIRLQNYATRYRPGLNLVLKGITAQINAGEKVGIVGRTGAGKSSLTLALFRLIEPASGSILIDGRNIAEMGLHDLRSKITILPQDPVLFSGTLRMNLDPFDGRNDDKIWQALEHAHLKSFVDGLPEKLDHECGEGGQNLSVGQRQLVCLARTLLRKTKILVLDEATAAVDMETDDLIQVTIREEFKDCTILTIAHRLNTVIDYDRIMVLDNGEIREFDSPSVLLENKNGIFYGMAKDAGLT